MKENKKNLEKKWETFYGNLYHATSGLWTFLICIMVLITININIDFFYGVISMIMFLSLGLFIIGMLDLKDWKKKYVKKEIR